MGLEWRPVARDVGRSRLRRWGRRGSDVAQRRDVVGLQAHQRVGAHDQLPPALDARVVGEAVVPPAQVIFTGLEAVFYPGAPSEGAAYRAFDLSRVGGH